MVKSSPPQLAMVLNVSEPLTIKEIMERTWFVGDPISGDELLLYDTVPWMPCDYDLDPLRLVRYDEKDEPVEWGIGDALSLLQSFYPKPIDWERERWAVLILRELCTGSCHKNREEEAARGEDGWTQYWCMTPSTGIWWMCQMPKLGGLCR